MYSETPIDKYELECLLTQDSYYRKLKQWPLLTLKDIFPIFNRNVINCFATTVQKTIYDTCNYNYNYVSSNTRKNIERQFFGINALLQTFKNKLIVCGGSVLGSLFQKVDDENYYDLDVDIFFYNSTIEEANIVRIQAIEFLIAMWKLNNNNSYYIKRNEYTTTLCILINHPYNSGCPIIEYQFIHRIYPDISSIIGGFDLSICMVAYDGEQIYSTPLGAWSIKNLSIIIDTTRRSTSFEYRLEKYYRRGYRLIFPGLPRDIINNAVAEKIKILDMESSKMISKIKTIMDEYNYESSDILNQIKYDYKNQSLHFHNSILKHFNITVYNSNYGQNIFIDKYYQSYLKSDNISNYAIDKISDYSSVKSHPSTYSNENGAYLRADKLSAVCTILIIDSNDNIREKLLYEADNPNLELDDMLTKYHNYTETVKHKYHNSNHETKEWWIKSPRAYKNEYNDNVDRRRLIKCFGKLAPEVIKVRDSDAYYHYVDQMVEKMKFNASLCMDKLVGIKWITDNPGRQWTSSINPIIEDPRDWYGAHYESVLTGIPSNIETTLRLLMLRKDCVWNMINNDVFNHICLHLLKYYADKAWKYIDPNYKINRTTKYVWVKK
jgi:hypothetical protein